MDEFLFNELAYGRLSFDAAKICALTAAKLAEDAWLGDKFAGLAVALLGRSAKEGFNNKRMMEELEKPEFRPLHSRRDYQHLKRELSPKHKSLP